MSSCLSDRRRPLATVCVLLALSSLAACGQTADTATQFHVQREALLTDLQVLSADSLQGREIGTQGGRRAAAYLVRRFRAIGLPPLGEVYARSFEADIGSSRIEGVNLLGWIAGSEPSAGTIVLMAHYDHVGVEDEIIYNGADDNASGASALVALADYFLHNPLAHSLIVAALDGEEYGLLGARDLATEIASDYDSLQIALAVNMDMISRSDSRRLYVVGTSHTPSLVAPVDRVARSTPFDLIRGHDGPQYVGRGDWSLASDHAVFHRLGVPFLYFGVEDHEDYHQPTDDFERIDPLFFAQVVETIGRVLIEVDRELAP